MEMWIRRNGMRI